MIRRLQRARMVEKQLNNSGMNFVLVHGINDTHRKFRTMQKIFEAKGHRCIVPSLKPKNGSKGLDFLANQLKETIQREIDELNSNIILIGFSMGGLIARFYLQELEGYQVTRLFFSISVPHHGSILAFFASNRGIKQMRPHSDFLENLAANSGRLTGLKCYSYWTPFDLMILPATSSIWRNAENIRINSICHPFMVKNKKIINDILIKSESFAFTD
jgi:triacylglycerol lipase